MKIFTYLFLFLLIFSCSQNNEEKIKHLNGYWEIAEATSDTQTKTYKYNEFIDYFIINDSLKGFRKKLKPTLDGNFIKTNIVEELTITIDNNIINLNYKTNFSERKETVLKLTKDELKVMNNNNQTYSYKRYQPLQLD